MNHQIDAEDLSGLTEGFQHGPGKEVVADLVLKILCHGHKMEKVLRKR